MVGRSWGVVMVQITKTHSESFFRYAVRVDVQIHPKFKRAAKKAGMSETTFAQHCMALGLAQANVSPVAETVNSRSTLAKWVVDGVALTDRQKDFFLACVQLADGASFFDTTYKDLSDISGFAESTFYNLFRLFDKRGLLKAVNKGSTGGTNSRFLYQVTFLTNARGASRLEEF